MKRPTRLRSQLLLSHLLVTLAGITLIILLTAPTLVNAPFSEAEHTLEDVGFLVSNQLEEPLSEYLEEGKTKDKDQLRAILAQFATRDQIELVVITQRGEVITALNAVPNGEDSAQTLEVRGAFNKQDIHDIRWSHGNEILYAGILIEHEDKIYGVLRLGVAMAPVREAQGRVILTLIFVALSSGAAVSLIAWFIANNLTRPIAQLTLAAKRMAEGKLDQPVPTEGTEELAQLARAFNEMAKKLNVILENQRAFVANASHELRTPLTSVKLRIEALRDGAAQDPEVGPKFMAEVESEVDRLGKMVNDLLDLSRIEADLESQAQADVNLVQLAEEARDAFSVRAGRTAVSIAVESARQSITVKGNESQLRRLIDNLLDNAIKYTPRDGKVILKISEAEGEVKLIVQDTGVGIPAEELPKIFERFYRGESPPIHTIPRESSGLGLSIVHSIARAHGGEIVAESEQGKGTTITVLFKIKTFER
ncbi:MAG: HAMP domain-containing protein [Chloroflexi bacterium]|nr:HAMP domain-containing protein [Chloroflexota bacterium]